LSGQFLQGNYLLLLMQSLVRSARQTHRNVMSQPKYGQINCGFLTILIVSLISLCRLRNTTQPGPALASAGPDWKHFCGAPFSGVCRNFEGHQVILEEAVSDVKWGPKRPCQSRGVWGHATQFNLSSRGFSCPFHGHFRNAQ